MQVSETKRHQDLKFASYTVIAIILETVIILWPLACTFSGKGYIELWGIKVAVPERLPDGEFDETAMDEWMDAQLTWLIIRRIVGRLVLITSLLILAFIHTFLLNIKAFGRIFSVNFMGFLAFVLVQWILTGIDIRFDMMITPRLTPHIAMLLIYSGFTSGFFIGILVALVVERFIFSGLIGKLLAGLPIGAVFMCALNPGLAPIALGALLGVLIGTPLGVLMMYGLKQAFVGHISTIKAFFRPWRLENYSFRKAIAFFGLVYMIVVLIFSMWFYACYLEGTEENPFFNTGKIAEPDWWDFFYFSFVTILTLGYGDISPLHPFPQGLVILESIIGVGMVAGYLSIILQVAGRKGQSVDTTTREDNG